jgi:hypothetical protein
MRSPGYALRISRQQLAAITTKHLLVMVSYAMATSLEKESKINNPVRVRKLAP